MYFALEGGTDAANMVVFDPAAIPADFDTGDDPVGQLETLQREGRAYQLPSAGDGTYSLGVCVNEDLLEHLRPFGRALDMFEEFHVPSGRLHFAGIEYDHGTDDAMWRRFPHE